MLTFDGKGVVLHREDLREATRKAAEQRRRQREPLSRFKRLKPGEKKHSKRMATVAAVWSCPDYAELHIVGAMQSSGLCGVRPAACVNAGDYMERYSA